MIIGNKNKSNTSPDPTCPSPMLSLKNIFVTSPEECEQRKEEEEEEPEEMLAKCRTGNSREAYRQLQQKIANNTSNMTSEEKRQVTQRIMDKVKFHLAEQQKESW